MSSTKKAINSAIGSMLVSAVALSSAASAGGENPFVLSDLKSDYSMAEAGGETNVNAGQAAKVDEGKCGSKMKGMMDADKDGKVSKDEFIKHHEHMFEMMDKDKNGMLDDSEMGHAGAMKKDMMGGSGMGGGMGAGMKHGSGQTGGH